ncbi:DUF4407 domain-containing protein [Polaribacter atrinae]|uniref:DUF4407 domain-containing protein n=1 Tax=Polaribacter atrinae TaxID=1333662 RepID=UPI0030FC093A
MRNSWMKFGCFLTGYNYNIMKSSSEASAKAVKKYTAAILIVSIIWGFIGFTFANKYVHLDTLGSVIGGVIAVFIIIQIEKQIILNVGKNRSANIFRTLIALIMAFLGSIIIDQMIFKDDIELKKEEELVERVNNALPGKVAEINQEIARLDSLISYKNNERTNLIKEITETPIITLPGYETVTKPGKTTKIIIDELGNTITKEIDTIFKERKYTSSSRENPKAAMLPTIDTQIKDLSIKRDEYSLKKLDMREDLEKQFRSKVGFLDEINTMINILSESVAALVVWFLWFFFLFFIELFVVSSKWGKNTETDYDIAVLHQRDVRINAIKQLSSKEKL